MNKRQKIKACAEWLVWCIQNGWAKKHLDELERLWWQYHGEEEGI